jgi:hypothetical protein
VIDVMPGDHGIKADLDGKHADAVFHTQAGTTVEVNLSWPSPAPTPSASAAPTLSPPPAASATASKPPPEQPPSSAPRETEVHWTPTRAAITGASAVAGIVGLVVGITGNSAKSSADVRISKDNAQIGSSSCSGAGASPACTDLSGAFKDRNDAAGRATAGFIIGGVGLAAAVGTTVAWYVWPAKVSVSPVGSAQGGGFVVSGSF